MKPIPASDLMINPDGSIFHLHMRPEELAGKVILVGDPGRVDMVASHFDTIDHQGSNREFVWRTGRIGSERITVLSTGIGPDNIDIVMNELDALVNVDFETRMVRYDRTALTILRLGTSGAVQPDIPLGSFVASSVTLGIDSLARFYKGATAVCDDALEESFVKHMEWPANLSRPYALEAPMLLRRRFADMAIDGFTISAPGFYAPQGRVMTLEPQIDNFVEKVENFEYKGRKVTNIEMESAPMALLSALMGHQWLTICLIVAQRHDLKSDVSYKEGMERLVSSALERFI